MPTPTKRTTAPAYQFYPGDFLKDENVLKMSYTEIGIYQMLLCHAWNNRGLPSDLREISQMLKLPQSRFKKLWAGVLGRCFVARGDRFVNPRQEAERTKQAEYRRRQSDNGSKGGRPNVSQPKAINNPPLSSGKARVLKTEEEDPLSSVVIKEKDNVIAFDGQAAFRKLCALYPAARVDDSRRVSDLFFDALGKSGEWSANFALMLANLQTHLVSHEWSVKRFIPNLDKWLESGKWKRPMDADAPARTPTVLSADETRKRYLA